MKNGFVVAFALVGTAAVAQTAETVLKSNKRFPPETNDRLLKAIEEQCAQWLLRIQKPQ